MARIIIFLLIGLLQGKYITNGASSSYLTFKQPNFHLDLNSFSLDKSGTKMYFLTVDELLPILKLVSTKFSKIYTHPSFTSLLVSSTLKGNAIAEAVALHNKQNKNKLELLLTIYENTISKNTFNEATEIASRANSIFPRSVKYLLANIQFGGDTKQVLNIKDVSSPFKIGIIIPFHAVMNNNASVAMENVNLVILDFGIREGRYGNVEYNFNQIILDYEKCREKIEKELKLNSILQRPLIGLQVKWFSGVGRSSYLSQLWLKINEWSVENNVKIFIASAFDPSVCRFDDDCHGGRWRVTLNKRKDLEFEDTFGQKVQAMEDLASKQASLNEADGDESGNSTSSNNNYLDGRYVIPIVGTAIGFIVVVLILVFLYKLCQRREVDAGLTRKEIGEFYKGLENSKKSERTDSVSLIEGIGYKKEVEVDKRSFRLSEICLGSGAFGEVWKAIVIKEGVEIAVAAKTLKKGCPTTTLKSFLSEIKVMGYLGQHENLVGMVGAYTKELESGKVIVFTEFCENGSLEKYLRNLAKNLISGSEDCEIKVHENYFGWFRRWCFEIANGMEYLSSKNVVHADLATRNVLLNDKFTAKISDFGLSRRLYDYTNYVKNQQEPLPWKWMAPESLQRLEFNEKTDVWACGVTMWEIYSLGSIPYPILSWTLDFPTQLVKGLRMEKPLYDDVGMYEIMLKCWNISPLKRPTFSKLKRNIQGMGVRSSHGQKLETN